jgi:hypothetical protein
LLLEYIKYDLFKIDSIFTNILYETNSKV